MLSNFFKKHPEYIDVEVQGGISRKRKILILIIVAAIAMLAFGSFGGEEDTSKQLAKGQEKNITTEEYIKENEKRLEEILSAVQGAGKIKAMITVEEIGEKVVAVDKKSETVQENKENSSSRSVNQENTTLVFDAGSEEKPFVVKEKLPMPSGVLIVATGAGSEEIRLEIYEAVKALYGISGHRIKVTKGSIK
ncbi:MAG: hypothetical protein IJV86_00710 [Clostridia bacterium]|nr:hypothetical protein [Clostridia bacterium]